MSNVTPPSVPAGWHPDPAGTPRQRWWDGGAWTEHYAEVPVVTQQPGIIQQPYSYAASAESLKAPEGIQVYNIWIWLVLALPALSTILHYLLRDGSSLVTSVVLYGLCVFFAYRDYKALLGLGVPRPFHWAWGFLSMVYVIGRSVVVRRRSGHGILPMWIAIAYMAIIFVLAIIVAIIFI